MEGRMNKWDIIIPLAALAIGVAVTTLVMRRRRAAAEPPA
jgi:hypothetical protein